MVGDTPHDAEASKRAGILCFGVLTGGHTAETLIQAGAVRVWNDADDLLMHLDEALQMQGSTRS
jgi:phosphoglycolate phosphatase-like HAD superfamily hydrolase